MTIDTTVTCDICKLIPKKVTMTAGETSYWKCEPVLCQIAEGASMSLGMMTDGPYQICSLCFSRMYNEYAVNHKIGTKTK